MLPFAVLGALAASVYALIATLWPAQSTVTYCYQSVLSQSEFHINADCFEVSPFGIFGKVFSRELDDNEVRDGHVIPGLWDSHGHLLAYGEFLHSVNIFGAESLDEVRTRVIDYATERPDAGSKSEWIRGAGWDQASYGRMPTAVRPAPNTIPFPYARGLKLLFQFSLSSITSRPFETVHRHAELSKADLEAAIELRGKYIMLDRVDAHCVWVSQAVLDLLPDPFPDIPGGEIATDPGKGVFCDNAMDPIMEVWPKPDRYEKTRYVQAAIRELNKVGLVGMHDAGVVPKDMNLFKELADTEDWTLRVYAMLECEKRNTFCPQEAVHFARDDGLLQARSVKLFAGTSKLTLAISTDTVSDGALGSWGSAMIEPYSDRPSTTGSLLVNASTLTSLTQSWAASGYQVNIHAIGDLANRLAIDAFESAYSIICPDESAASCQSKHRFRIEHCQIVHLDDQKRIFDLGVIPSIQPTHATSDMCYAEDRLGPKRTAEEAYRMRSFLPLPPILGSDFPVEPPNPFEGIYAAVARRSPKTGLAKDGTKNGWYMEEALTMEEALRGFTVAPAKGAFLEGKAGVIHEGAYADWVVLDEPFLNMDVEELRTLKIRETWVGGKCVYRRKDGSVKDELR